jgi:hypothetical protein
MKKYTLQKLMIIALVILSPAIILSQAVNSPGTVQNQPYDYCTTCSGAKWINPSNVGLLDNQFSSATLQPYMSCYHDQCYWSRFLDCHNFGFSIPSDAIIRGIRLDITGFSDKNATITDGEVSLMKNSVVIGSNLAMTGYWPTVNSLRTYGGANQLWDHTWTASEIDSSQFGVFIKVKNTTSLIPTVNLDAVLMTITYELATGIFEQTSAASLSPLQVYSDANSSEMIINFDSQDHSKAFMKLYDIQGKEYYSAKMVNKQGDILQEKVNTSELKSGIYLVNIYSDNKLYSSKVALIK